MAPAGHAVPAASTHDVTFTTHAVAEPKVAHVRTDGDYLADKLVTDHEGNWNSRSRPLVPRVDVEVGAADTGLLNSDENIIDPQLRHGYFLKPKALLGPRLPQRQHLPVDVHGWRGAAGTTRSFNECVGLTVSSFSHSSRIATADAGRDAATSGVGRGASRASACASTASSEA